MGKAIRIACALTMHFCPRCGQRVLLRLGVLMSPRRADVFDAIKRQSKYGGIRGDALASMFSPNKPASAAKKCIAVHISNINTLLANTGWQIICEREGAAAGFYRLRRVVKFDSKRLNQTLTLPLCPGSSP